MSKGRTGAAGNAGASMGPPVGRPGERSWRDVVTARRPLQWNAKCSFFLHPRDAQWLRKTFELAEFEDAFVAAAAGIPGASDEQGGPCRTMVRTGRGAVRVEASPVVAEMLGVMAERQSELSLGDFGFWRVERQRPSAAPSLVVMGVPRGLTDQEVQQRLLIGSRSLVPDDLCG